MSIPRTEAACKSKNDLNVKVRIQTTDSLEMSYPYYGGNGIPPHGGGDPYNGQQYQQQQAQQMYQQQQGEQSKHGLDQCDQI